MSSPQKKKHKAGPAPQQKKVVAPPKTEPAAPANPLRFSIVLTVVFFVVALFGLLHHEMWRDEHQAWLVARDAHSLAQVFDNLRYEGNPALWHTLLFFITRITSDPAYMQYFHLLVACSFIFIFNRYAPLGNVYKILFTFGYFPLYEYTLISRSYSLGILLLFTACVLFKNRKSNYILLGLVLALLANVTIFSAILAFSLAGVLLVEYIFAQQKNTKSTLQLGAGLAIFGIGFICSILQILPEPDNSFPSAVAPELFDFQRWSQVASRLFSTYFYIPTSQKNFWNTNIYSGESMPLVKTTYWHALQNNPLYLWTWVYLPCLTFLMGIILFIRKPLILLFYAGATIGLLAVFYFTLLLHERYCGHLLLVLILCFWLSEYVPEKKYNVAFLNTVSALGRKLSMPFFAVVLVFQVLGAMVAYSKDVKYKFSTCKDAADYILENKLDTLPMAGITDFSVSPVTSYLNKKIYYPQMRDYGTFIIWNGKRQNQMNFEEIVNNIDSFMTRERPRILLIRDRTPQITADGINYLPLEKGMIKSDLQMDLLRSFNAGIVPDEKYFIYTVQRVDSTKVDYSKYPMVN